MPPDGGTVPIGVSSGLSEASDGGVCTGTDVVCVGLAVLLSGDGVTLSVVSGSAVSADASPPAIVYLYLAVYAFFFCFDSLFNF